jgi:hypothetical protein
MRAALPPHPLRACAPALVACPRRSLSLESMAPLPGLPRIPRASLRIRLPALPRGLDPPLPAA